MSELTHWKKGDNPDYLGAYALQPGEEPIYTIKSVGYEMVTGSDGKKEECRVARFVEPVKPMILNTTNCKTIQKIYKTPYIEQWVGKRIQIYVDMVKSFGDVVEALRIRPKAPATNKPLMDTKYKGWDAALAAIQNGETSVAFLEQKYSIPASCKELLQEAEKNAQS